MHELAGVLTVVWVGSVCVLLWLAWINRELL